MKVAGKSKQTDLIRNTDCRERPNLYHVIDTGYIFNKSAKKLFCVNGLAQIYYFKILRNEVIDLIRTSKSNTLMTYARS